MRHRLLVLPPLALSLALSLTACGSQEPPSAREAYLAEAEAVCTEGNAAREALESPASVAAIPAFVRGVVTAASDVTAELAALEPPPEDAAELQERFVGPLQEQVQEGSAFAREVETTAADDPAALLALLPEAPLDTAADLEFLRDYGFEACVELADTGSADPLG